MKLNNTILLRSFFFCLLFVLISFASADRDLIERVNGRRFVTGQSLNTSLTLKANAAPEGPVLAPFNTNASSLISASLGFGKPTNGTPGVTFKLTGSMFLKYPLGQEAKLENMGSMTIDGQSGDGRGVGMQSSITPCDLSALLEANHGVSMISQFTSDMAITIQVDMEYQLFDTSMTNNTKTNIPAYDYEDHITYVPVNQNYDLTLIFESTRPDITISSRLSRLYVDCSAALTYNMSTLNVGKWNITLFNKQGPTIVQVENSKPSGWEDISLTFVESSSSDHGDGDDDDKLKTWEIALIVVGTLFVAFVVLVAILGVVIWRRKKGYTLLD